MEKWLARAKELTEAVTAGTLPEEETSQELDYGSSQDQKDSADRLANAPDAKHWKEIPKTLQVTSHYQSFQAAPCFPTLAGASGTLHRLRHEVLRSSRPRVLRDEAASEPEDCGRHSGSPSKAPQQQHRSGINQSIDKSLINGSFHSRASTTN